MCECDPVHYSEVTLPQAPIIPQPKTKLIRVAERKKMSKKQAMCGSLAQNNVASSDRDGRVTLKTFSVAVTNDFIKKVIAIVIQVSQYESNVI